MWAGGGGSGRGGGQNKQTRKKEKKGGGGGGKKRKSNVMNITAEAEWYHEFQSVAIATPQWTRSRRKRIAVS